MNNAIGRERSRVDNPIRNKESMSQNYDITLFSINPTRFELRVTEVSLPPISSFLMSYFDPTQTTSFKTK